MHGAFRARGSHASRAWRRPRRARSGVPPGACARGVRARGVRVHSARARTASARAARHRCRFRRWCCRRGPLAAAPSARQCLSVGARPWASKPRRRGARANVRQRGARRSDGVRPRIVVRYTGVGAPSRYGRCVYLMRAHLGGLDPLERKLLRHRKRPAGRAAATRTARRRGPAWHRPSRLHSADTDATSSRAACARAARVHRLRARCSPSMSPRRWSGRRGFLAAAPSAR
jgi:hypothetical protein